MCESTADMSASTSLACPCRLFTGHEILAHNNRTTNEGEGFSDNAATPTGFLVVVDGYVVDVGLYLAAHPGGRANILTANSADIGASGVRPFDFSFSRGRNAHFAGTANAFSDACDAYMAQDVEGAESRNTLPPFEFQLPTKKRGAGGPGGPVLRILGRYHDDE